MAEQLWKKVGRPKRFDTADDLWEAACGYFQFCDDNPWHKNEVLKGGEDPGRIVPVPTSRPYTIQGMCLHINLDDNTFYRYSSEEGYEQFHEVCKRIRQVIYTQKFEGAAVGAFNANLIARDLDIAEKVNNNISGPGGGPVQHDHFVFEGVGHDYDAD